MWFKILAAVAQLQTCVVTITGLLVGILVNNINWRLLYHTRWVSPITAKCRFTTWTCCGLFQQWHEHQAPYDAFHIWFHFDADRDFHCWHFFSFAFYGNLRQFEESILSTFFTCRKNFFSLLENLQFLFCLLSHSNTFFCLSLQSHPLDLLPYFYLIFSHFCGEVSRCFLHALRRQLLLCRIKYRL